MSNSLMAKGFTAFAQIMVKIQPIWDKYKLLIVFVVGLLLGWFLLGYTVFPVEWANATPAHLRADWKSAYLGYTAQEYARTGDLALLQSRLGLDLQKAADAPWLENEEQLQQDINMAIQNASQFQLGSYVGPLTQVENLAQQQPSALYPTEEEGAATGLGSFVKLAGILLIVVLVVAGAGAAWFLISQDRGRQRPEVAVGEPGAGIETTEFEVSGEGQPVKSFNTPYVLGDDYFDPSFSIEIGSDFLGECGIGISETLGAGDPKKVTAFEAWLFDKSDIRTVTKVLASEYAFNDPDLKAKLEPKGDVVMIKPGQEVILETSALRVKARIRDLEYAQGASLPDNSFIQKVNFELQAWVKQMDQYESFDEGMETV
ncbi:MAG: hypothetical protein ACP5JG_07365 [Anaerolineae bacterium]